MFCSIRGGVVTERCSVLLLVMLAVLTGCTLPQDNSPPPQAYLLGDGGAFTPAPARRFSGKILLVTVSKGAPGFDSPNIAYTREPLKLDYYNDSVWSDTPAKMLLPILVRAFETTGAFKAVVSPPSPMLADIRVDMDLIRLQQEFMTMPSRVRLTVRLKVVDMKNRQVLGTQIFEAVEPAPSGNAYGGVQAANAAMHKVLSEMVPFTLSYLE
ncbi:MAG TPA: ABC-type transport auxiliary lipoprotein family protein [Candidatus Competibacteraceae bacterium]|mgnify:CR=1 FL=1|nr:membrane integrity-associated transporter subunit PqiC [Candidatus Competibacteraceae bacterium]MCP5133548.1 membrane integrity-associated transporter subunit PqiC [Gammaproteobacteria bacterium]HPF57499.1 ABC-type transport auxiliary lipoprotein family protein [Candidatus Competibacteraceae bacterium]HRY17205.1 ABC-type transport auxiliary lipoprotein family protein [Candidatus Competibacteraceae bacterium]